MKNKNPRKTHTNSCELQESESFLGSIKIYIVLCTWSSFQVILYHIPFVMSTLPRKKMSTNSFIVCHYNIYRTYAGIEEQMKLCNKYTAESNHLVALGGDLL